MNKNIDEILTKIRELEDELEDEYRKPRNEWGRKKLELAEEFQRQQRRYKTGLFRFLLCSRLLVALTAPIIYAGWIPFLVMDVFVTFYQAICFPIYRIPKVRRSDYLVFDREDLPYLNIIEKFNCFFCSYEQYWCPIKHARRLAAAHDRYPNFFDHGDAQAYQQGLNRLRKQYENT